MAEDKKPAGPDDAVPTETDKSEGSKRNTSNYLETRASTPTAGAATSKTPTGSSSVRATLVGILPTSPTSPGSTTAPGAGDAGATGGAPHKAQPTSLVSAPAPRAPTPASTSVTLVGTPLSAVQLAAARKRTATPTSGDAGRTFTPQGRDVIPEELNVKAAGNSRTRIGLPSITPRLFKRKDGDGQPTQPAKPGRETVLLTAIKRTPPSTPAVEAVYTAPSGGHQAASGAATQPPVLQNTRRIPSSAEMPAVRPRARRVRPKVPPAEIRATKYGVKADPYTLILLSNRLVPQGAAIRSLRHRLADKGDPRVILVSSAQPGEGKTFCAANLALALAEIRRSRVLLLEANLRTPALARTFGIKPGAPVLGQLEHHRLHPADPWNVAELSTHDMHLLALDPDVESNQTLDGRLFASCLDSLRGAYDYIIIDGPAVSVGPDVSLLEDAVDGILFVARANTTRAKTLREALDQISPQDLLGVVLLDD